MKNDIKTLINRELEVFLRKALQDHKLGSVDKLLKNSILDFVLRDGKRIRPIFFLISYLGFSRKTSLPKDVLKSALSFELLHDFLLVHDDIIDNSSTRRGKPTVHKIIEKQLKSSDKIGKDLAILVGDIIYAMSIEAFLEIKASQATKEKALKTFLHTTILTGAGEYKDVLNGLKNIKDVSLSDIRQNYLLKTAQYTFRSPIICGAMLGGASSKDLKLLSNFAMHLGEAFQIQDDYIGIFSQSKKIGKSVLSDLIEAKKTYPLHFAYKRASKKEKAFIDRSLGNTKLKLADLMKIRKIIKDTGAMQLTKTRIISLLNKARQNLKKTSMAIAQKELILEKADLFIKID